MIFRKRRRNEMKFESDVKRRKKKKRKAMKISLDKDESVKMHCDEFGRFL